MVGGYGWAEHPFIPNTAVWVCAAAKKPKRGKGDLCTPPPLSISRNLLNKQQINDNLFSGISQQLDVKVQVQISRAHGPHAVHVGRSSIYSAK